MLKKMEYAIRNDSLPMEVVEHSLICLKEEWMKYVEILDEYIVNISKNYTVKVNTLFILLQVEFEEGTLKQL